MTAPEPDLDAIKARLAAATRGPWSWCYTAKAPGDAAWVIAATVDGEVEEICAGDGFNPSADAEFIAHAPTDIAWLLGEVNWMQGHLRSVAEKMLDMGPAVLALEPLLAPALRAIQTGEAPNFVVVDFDHQGARWSLTFQRCDAGATTPCEKIRALEHERDAAVDAQQRAEERTAEAVTMAGTELVRRREAEADAAAMREALWQLEAAVGALLDLARAQREGGE